MGERTVWLSRGNRTELVVTTQCSIMVVVVLTQGHTVWRGNTTWRDTQQISAYLMVKLG